MWPVSERGLKQICLEQRYPGQHNLVEFYEDNTQSAMLAVASSDHQNTENYYVISMDEINGI